MSDLGTLDRPLRVAIVGSGPAGFYTAEHLLKQNQLAIEVDMFDRLPTPYGLVRAGVAPDHPKIKSVIRIYEKTAARPGFRFFGNVEVGSEITAAELAARYHAVIYAYGTTNDRKLGIPGEDLAGSHPATAFVAWYNAHPDHADNHFDLGCTRAVVIGNGNVAADVARMLTLSREELEQTDTADHAIGALASSAIDEVVILGRRGPAQAAFTNPEVRELGELLDADVIVDAADCELDEHSRSQLEGEDANPTHVRNYELFAEFSQRPAAGKRKRVVLKFFASPIELRGSDGVESIVIGRNRLEAAADGAVHAVDTGEREELECGLVLRSIGYKGAGLEGLPFDERRGTIPNDHGRVVDPETAARVPGLYAVGWIKRGPNGVIGTNKKDAQDTVDSLLTDFEADLMPEPSASDDPDEIVALIAERCPGHVSFAGWKAIDQAEVDRGEPLGRPRMKFTSVAAMLEAARTAEPVGS